MTDQRKAKSTEFDASFNKGNAADFLPLEDGLAHKIPKGEELENKATVLYIGRIPHGFYEDEMEGFFKQFGTIKRLKIARNRKTGKSRHYGFIEFEYPEVAKIVAECMHNYFQMKGKFLLGLYQMKGKFLSKVSLLSLSAVGTRWRGVNHRYKPVVDFVQIERKEHNKDRTLEEHQKLLITILKRDKKRRKKLEAAGVEYECPSIEGANQPVPKKIRFD